MAKIKQGELISRSWGLGLERGEESKKVHMALCILLLLLLESTLKRSEISLKLLLIRSRHWSSQLE